ncbi:MAG: tryptophan synthase subunit alpha [Acidimicrobiia bacterium]|nr:tryptophan synthase subunit alpha [Acidimicrobiia bacterium]
MSRFRLERLFAEVRSSGRTALLPFMTAGLPSVSTSVDLFVAMADSGADGFEVGIPYSDPMMDGPTIQAANRRALAGGVTVEKGLEVVAAVVERTGKPVIVMTYANPIFRIGAAIFAERCREAGASGVIVADLPLEEAAAIQDPIEATGLGMVLFAAPTSSNARLEAIAAANPVFIYGIADLGVTGERRGSSSHARELAARIRTVTGLPLVMGVGISTPDQARSLAGEADGIIVGSALVRRVLEAPDEQAALDAVRNAVVELAGALR